MSEQVDQSLYLRMLSKAKVSIRAVNRVIINM